MIYYVEDYESEVLRDEGVLVEELPLELIEDMWAVEWASWILGCTNGVPSNSANPPLSPMSTTCSSILSNSLFLKFGRITSADTKGSKREVQYLCLSNSSLSSIPEIDWSSLEQRSWTRVERSSSLSSTSSRRFD